MKVGVWFYGLGTALTGILDIAWGAFDGSHQPIKFLGINPPTQHILAYVAGVWLIAAGLAILWQRSARVGASASAIAYLIFAAMWLPRCYAGIHTLGLRIPVVIGVSFGLAQQIMLVAPALIVYVSTAAPDSLLQKRATTTARWMLGLPPVLFGLFHLTSIRVFATIVPHWMSFGYFWAGLTGIAFILAGSAICSGIMDLPAARLLALMLLLFEGFVEIPPIFIRLHNQATWGATVYNLAAIGACLIFAESLSQAAPIKDELTPQWTSPHHSPIPWLWDRIARGHRRTSGEPMLSLLTLRGVIAGVIAGFASGLLGVTPGGILVPVISLLLPYSQHVAQGISLVVQAPPTSITGLSAYSRRGSIAKFSSVLPVSVGFIAGGPVGAHLAKLCSERELRWMFVGYLLILTLLAIRKKRSGSTNGSETQSIAPSPFVPFFLIGIVAGLSSGLLGIGGGLAIVALSVVLLHQKQHDAQILSLAVSAFPLTLPAAWVYARQGFNLPWLGIGGLIAGLAVGSWLGGVYASRLTEERLKQSFVALLAAMTAYMAFVAGRS